VSRPLAVVAACLLLAGCSVGLPVGETPTATDTATPAPVPTNTATPSPDRVAPGLTTAGVTDAAALLRTHVDAHEGARYAVQFGERRVRDGESTTVYSGLARVDGSCDSYSVGVYQPRPAPPRLSQWYANGTVALSRSFVANVSTTDPGVGFTEPAPTVVTADGLPADPCTVRPVDPTFAPTLAVLYGSLDFEVTPRGDGTWLTASEGTVARLPVPAPGDEPLRNVTVGAVRITLAPDGTVTSFVLSYTGETTAGRVEGRLSVRYERLAGPVEPPWPAGATER
jgi:hypothetical protein